MSSHVESKAWIARNKEALLVDYRAYALRHDYDPEGIPLTFDAYAAAAFRNEMEMRQFQADRARIGKS